MIHIVILCTQLDKLHTHTHTHTHNTHTHTTHTHTHTLSFVVPLHLLQLQQTVADTTKVVWTMMDDQKQMRKDQIAVGATVYISIVF